MRHKIIITVLALWLCAASAVHAQEPPGHDPIGDALIPPDIVMAHQQALGLSDAQRSAIQADAENAQQHFESAQWQLAAATEKLAAMLKQSHVDQTKALAQLDAVLNLERVIKHTQLTLMIEVKNELTPEQQVQARQFIGGGTK
ncbi:MAG TPA: periplasmic heavy metal sensor [Candidatus Eremiobacteraceae bacterium]